MASNPPAVLAAGTVFDGRYEIVRCIGRGGVGAVYEVVHLETRRHHALKLMLPSKLDRDDLRRRFEREATVVAGVESEHIADVHDAGVDEESGSPYLVMELLKGEELGQMLERRGRLPADEVVLYLSQAAVALEKTHAAGILHRDLKPANLFVTYRDDGRASIKLLDFGIAKALTGDSDVRTTRGVLGTPHYLAPEQIHGLKRQSGRTDGYALAHIAYTLLTGAPYWQHDPSSEEKMYGWLVAVSEGATEAARERAAKHSDVELPEAFDEWFAKATAVKPADRFATCTELVTALAVALDVKPPVILRRSSSLRPAPPAADGVAARRSDANGDEEDRHVRAAAEHAAPAVVQPARARPLGLWIALGLGAAAIVAVLAVRSTGDSSDAQPRDTPDLESGAVPAASVSAATPILAAGRVGAGGAAGADAGSDADLGTAAVPSTSVPLAAGARTVPPAHAPASPGDVRKPASTAAGWVPPVTER